MPDSGCWPTGAGGGAQRLGRAGRGPASGSRMLPVLAAPVWVARLRGRRPGGAVRGARRYPAAAPVAVLTCDSRSAALGFLPDPLWPHLGYLLGLALLAGVALLALARGRGPAAAGGPCWPSPRPAWSWSGRPGPRLVTLPDRRGRCSGPAERGPASDPDRGRATRCLDLSRRRPRPQLRRGRDPDGLRLPGVRPGAGQLHARAVAPGGRPARRPARRPHPGPDGAGPAASGACRGTEVQVPESGGADPGRGPARRLLVWLYLRCALGRRATASTPPRATTPRARRQALGAAGQRDADPARSWTGRDRRPGSPAHAPRRTPGRRGRRGHGRAAGRPGPGRAGPALGAAAGGHPARRRAAGTAAMRRRLPGTGCGRCPGGGWPGWPPAGCCSPGSWSASPTTPAPASLLFRWAALPARGRRGGPGRPGDRPAPRPAAGRAGAALARPWPCAWPAGWPSGRRRSWPWRCCWTARPAGRPPTWPAGRCRTSWLATAAGFLAAGRTSVLGGGAAALAAVVGLATAGRAWPAWFPVQLGAVPGDPHWQASRAWMVAVSLGPGRGGAAGRAPHRPGPGAAAAGAAPGPAPGSEARARNMMGAAAGMDAAGHGRRAGSPPARPPTTSWSRAVAAGDRAALELLYRRHAPWLAGRLAARTSSR